MALIPSMVLKQLYTFGSLRNSADGVRFSLKNRLSDATVTALNSVSFDGQQVPAGKLSLVLDTGEVLLPADLRA
ncbi:MAG: hydroxymethylglutaryl-CoA reductase, partial [Anaerolineae bacterium]|nr:hydroxymethylglutaryl-CoA reductase [Anaerolineae bacterium]MCB0240772.1 hydroxymethylglutaryl-CoA reductase [Anaerolineae bacterium]